MQLVKDKKMLSTRDTYTPASYDGVHGQRFFGSKRLNEEKWFSLFETALKMKEKNKEHYKKNIPARVY